MELLSAVNFRMMLMYVLQIGSTNTKLKLMQEIIFRVYLIHAKQGETYILVNVNP